MAPKLTSCYMFGMLLKYWLSTDCGFVVGDRVNSVGVLVSGGLLWHLVSGVVAGVDIRCSCEVEAVLCDVCCCDICCCDGCCCNVCCCDVAAVMFAAVMFADVMFAAVIFALPAAADDVAVLAEVLVLSVVVVLLLLLLCWLL